MTLLTFKKGIHPPYRKELARDVRIEAMPAPDVVRIPMGMHIGAPAKPIVARGDVVRIGQPIAEPQGFVSVPAHASISGKVKSIKDFPHPFGRNMPAVEIENDGEEQFFDQNEPGADPFSLEPSEIIRKVHDAGIVGMGGAAFPTHVKLSPPPDKHIDTLLLNAAECEPYLTCDFRLMLERGADVVNGIKIIQRVIGAKEIIIGIEDNKPEAIKSMNEAAACERHIKVVALETKYPQGSELQLMKAILDVELPKSKLPLEAGVVVQNVGTAVAVSELFKSGKPLYERVLTITGEGVENPKNVLVRIGTLVSDILKYAGGAKEGLNKLIMGGPMMGFTQHTDQVPVIKGSSGILLLEQQRHEPLKEQPCIRCGRCESNCPAYIAPSRIAKAVRYGKFDLAQTFNIMECIECGCCAFVCPSKIPLVQYIRLGKAEIMSMKSKEK